MEKKPKENMLDRFISYISPERAAKRQAYRNLLKDEQQRTFYDAGRLDRINGWYDGLSSAEYTDRNERDIIRSRARSLERNDDTTQSIVKAFRRNVVGKGYALQARTDNKELNKQIEDAWKEWVKAKNCDISAQQSFTEILRMAITRKKIDGGMLIVKKYAKDYSIVPLKLQCLEVDELDSDVIEPKYKGNIVAGGIEFDRNRVPVGYYIRRYSAEGDKEISPVFIKASDVIFYYSKNRPSQVREISDLASSIPDIDGTKEFLDAARVKERTEACFSVFVKKPTNPLSGRGSQTGGSYKHKSLAPGMIYELNPGDEVQTVNPSGSAIEVTNFLKMEQGRIAAGQGLSYECASRDMSKTNYSSARQGSIEDEGTFAEEFELLKEKVMDEVYESFVISGVLCGLFPIPDFWEQKRKYLDCQWVGAPKKWIDPMKEAKATQVAVMSGIKSYKQICAENGTDWEKQIDDMAEVNEYAAEKGIDISAIFGQSPAKGGENNDESNDKTAKEVGE